MHNELPSLYNSLISVNSIAGLSAAKALDHLGQLIDVSFHLQREQGLRQAIALSRDLESRQLTAEQVSVYHYFIANAWSDLGKLLEGQTNEVWSWVREERENEIFHLRHSLRSDGFVNLPKERKCQVLTNLANALNHIGRFVEAIEYWDEALSLLPGFGMALGNRGIGLTHYARTLYDSGHRLCFLRESFKDLEKALLLQLDEGAKIMFEKYKRWLEGVLSPISKESGLKEFSLGSSEEEIKYRKWCLNNRLFLNPLNDIGPHSIAAIDIFGLPSIITAVEEGPCFFGFFNQLKQEYASARYMLFSSTQKTMPHFSDRGVHLYNTLDYPSYSFSAESTKAAFRTAYSLFDKIAFFLNDYLGLGIAERDVSFKTLWYVSRNRKQGLADQFKTRNNWPLRGLFWLSKDLYEDRDGFKNSLEPQARDLSIIRNHIEHKYLKLHDDLWSGPPSQDNPISTSLYDRLAFSIYRNEFQEKSVCLIKMVRAAPIYLSLAIHQEEVRRRKDMGGDRKLLDMSLDAWEDDWKL